MAKITAKQLAGYAADQLQDGADSKTIARQIAALLLSERRTRDISTFARALETELHLRGKTQVVVTSATKVDDVIKNQLASLLGVDSPIFYEIINSDIIGGVHASTLESQIDRTIAGQLKVFKQAVNKD